MQKKPLVKLLVVFALAAGGLFAADREVRTTVTYISASAIYLDAGRAHGINVGDRVDVMRNDSLLAILEVRFVADQSASCRLLESLSTIQPGDHAIIMVSLATPTDTTSRTAETPQLPEKSEPTAPARKRRTNANRVSGRAGFEMLWQAEQAELSNTVVQPAFALRLRVENLLATQQTLSVRLRGRQTLRNREFRDSADKRWTGRIYDVSLVYDNPQSAFHYGIGRVLTNRLRGIGYFDGAFFDYRATKRTTVGIFGGTEPDARTTAFNSQELKYGVFGSYESGTLAAQRFRTTLALAGKYINGNISREFIYEQLDFGIGTKLWILQSAELNVNREWKSETGASSIEYANALLSLRYSVSPDWNATISYDNRKNYRTWETKDTPDSLFEDNRRQRVRFGMRWRVSQNLRFGAGYGLRSMASQNKAATTYTADVALQNALMRGLTVSAAVVGFSNAFTSGMQPSLSLSKPILPALLTALQVGRNAYEYRSTNDKIINDWIKLRMDAYFTTRLYGSAYVERYAGDSLALNRLFLESGIRW